MMHEQQWLKDIVRISLPHIHSGAACTVVAAANRATTRRNFKIMMMDEWACDCQCVVVRTTGTSRIKYLLKFSCDNDSYQDSYS
jgi:hypothetical protein